MSNNPSPAPPLGGRPKHPLLLAGAVSVLGGLLMLSPSLMLLRAPRDPSPVAPADVPGLDRAAVARGQALFAANCTACHGAAGTAVQGLGKDLVHSDFIAGCTDAQLLGFLKVGRDAGDPSNTTRVAMPPPRAATPRSTTSNSRTSSLSSAASSRGDDVPRQRTPEKERSPKRCDPTRHDWLSPRRWVARSSRSVDAAEVTTANPRPPAARWPPECPTSSGS